MALREPAQSFDLNSSLKLSADSLNRLCYRCFDIMVESPKEFSRARFAFLADFYTQHYLNGVLYYNLIKLEGAEDSDDYYGTLAKCQEICAVVYKTKEDLKNLCEAAKAGDLFLAARWRDEIRSADVSALIQNLEN